MKRFCSLLIAIMLAGQVWAQDFRSDYLFYTITSANTVEISGGNNSLTTINIPDTVTYDNVKYIVTSIGAKAFEGRNDLVSVTISNSVNSIGNSAFSGCSGLTSVIIPNSVNSIGNYAFSGCSSLTSIVVPNSVTNIGQNLFWGCSSLVSISLPFVGDKAHTATDQTYQYPFGYIFGYNSYTSYEGSTKTSQRYYYYDSYKKSHSIGEKDYYIPNSLKEVIITGGSYIQYGAFSNCSGLTSITIPNSVTEIGAFAFTGCSGLTSISLPFVGDKEYQPTDTYQYPLGYLFGQGNFEGSTKTTQSFYESSTSSMTSKDYYIPNSLKEVTITRCGYLQCGAFYNCSGLTTIIISDSTINIGD